MLQEQPHVFMRKNNAAGAATRIKQCCRSCNTHPHEANNVAVAATSTNMQKQGCCSNQHEASNVAVAATSINMQKQGCKRGSTHPRAINNVAGASTRIHQQ
jgi:hypothetical protein